MAEFFSAAALRGYTLHTPRGFLIFNAGKETRFIPEESRAKLEAEGVIAAKASSAATRSAAAAPRRGKAKKRRAAPKPAATRSAAPPPAPAPAGAGAPPAD